LRQRKPGPAPSRNVHATKYTAQGKQAN
jgi:hypothetical protein